MHYGLCVRGCHEIALRVSFTNKNHAISSHALIENSFFLSISELHFNVFGVLETKYLFHICVVALRSFFYWDTQQQHLWRREFLANEKFRPWKCIGFDSVLFVIVFLFRPPLGTKRP